MNTVQQNIEEVQRAYDEVKAHCMCLGIRDDGVSIVIIYPEGDWPDGKEGIHCTYGVHTGQGKAWALKKLLEQMEKDWIESFPGFKA